jgi:hypothetical protein
MADQPADRPTIFTDGAPAPPVTSFVASKSFCRFVNAINAHNMTLVGDATFNDGIFLTVAAVDRALKHDMGEDEQVFWKRSEGEGDELRDLKGQNPSFPWNFTVT